MEHIVRKGDIAFWIAAGFLGGVFAASEGWNIKLVIIISAATVTSVSLFSSKRLFVWKYALLIFFAGMIGIIYYFVYIHWTSSRIHLPSGKQTAFFGVVADEPKPAGNFVMFPLALSKPYRGTIDVFVSPQREFHFGDFLWVKGTIDPSKDFDEPPTIFLPQSSIVSSGGGFWLKAWSIKAKIFITKKFIEFFSADKAALLTEIVLGNTGAISPILKQQMDASGTSYIIGMYGYKIAILGAALLGLLKNYVPRKILLFFVIVVIWLFIFMTGGSVSAIRAGIMGSLALLAAALGRMGRARNSLTITALIMAIINPEILTDAAFQLSFLSFLGIYYLGPPIQNFFHWTNAGWLQWKEHAMLSLSTNFAIVPIVMATFGGFSLTSFVSNILIMIPWSMVILFGIIGAILGSVSSALAFFVIQLINILLEYELFIIRIFARVVIPLPNVFNSHITIIFYYGVLIIFMYYYGEAD